MPARSHATLVVVVALAQELGCGERSSGGPSSATASTTVGASVAAVVVGASTAGPLATTGPEGRLVFRDGRILLGPTGLTEIREAVQIRVTREKVTIEGIPVDEVPSLSDEPKRADGLFRALRARREDARLARYDAKPSDVVILDIDEDVPATAVKNVFQTCAFAGYPNTFFLVSRGDAGLRGSSAPPR